MLEVLGGRKFILVVALVVFAWILVVIGQVTAQEWIDMMKWILGIYGISNVGAKIATK